MNSKLKILCIGDPHIRIQDEEDINEYSVDDVNVR
jgi:hypothetical protein